MQGCGWGSGRSQSGERSGCQRVASRYARGADGVAVGAARPRAPAAARVSLPRLALRAWRRRRGRCAPGRLHLLRPPLTCARCLLVVGMSKTSCAFRAAVETSSVQGVLRAPAEGEGGRHTARNSLPPPLLRSSGALAEALAWWLTARGRRAGGVAAAPRGSRRWRAGRARPKNFGVMVVGGGAHTNSELPQAGFAESGEVLVYTSPEQGKPA